MKRLSLFVTAAFLLAAVLSCGKSNNNSNTGGNKTDSSKSFLVKITLNPLPAPNRYNFSGAITGLLPNLKEPTWKVNGTARPNEGTIAFTQDDFVGGVLTFEATTNVNMASLAVGGVTTSSYPYSVHIEPTINGKVKDSTTVSVTSTLNRQWTW